MKESRVLTRSQQSALLSLLSEMKVSVAGVQSNWLYRRLLSDSGPDAPVAIATVSRGDVLAGFAIAIIDQAKYWRDLGKRHPLLAGRILAGRMLGLGPFRRQREANKPGASLPAGHISFDDGGESWQDSSPAIAKIVMIGVRPSFQGRGIGSELYAALFAELSRRGVSRVDACVAHDNHASLYLHAATGWSMRHTAANIFCTRSTKPLLQQPDPSQAQPLRRRAV